MSTIAGWSFTEGTDLTDLFGDGTEGILAFLDNNMLIAIATDERFRDSVWRYYF